MNSYDLSRAWFNYCFDNPEKIRPIHTAIYMFSIEHCNRLGWKEKFGFPSQMVMEAIGVKNWRTYSKALADLVEWKFIIMIETSKNQYSSNIIAIVKNTKAPTKAPTKALDKALQKHSTKQGQSTVSIDKQVNKEQRTKNKIPTEDVFIAYAVEQVVDVKIEAVRLKYRAWVESGWETGGDKPKPIKNWKTTLLNTLTYIEKDASKKPFKYQP